jgi:L-iditol 2-dehydrogenase
MKMMKAVVKYENKPNATELREVPVPEIGESDVLVEVAYVGVCGTDPHMHNGTVVFNFNCPFISQGRQTSEQVQGRGQGYL